MTQQTFLNFRKYYNRPIKKKKKKYYNRTITLNNITIFILQYYTCGSKIIRKKKNRKPDFLQSLLLEMLLRCRWCHEVEKLPHRLRQCCQADKLLSSDDTARANFHFNKFFFFFGESEREFHLMGSASNNNYLSLD